MTEAQKAPELFSEAKPPSPDAAGTENRAEERAHGRDAAAPQQIPLQGWKDILWRTWSEVQKDNVPHIAAGIAFYVLLAFFPALASFVALYGLIADPAEAARHMSSLLAVFPGPVVDFLAEQMTRAAGARPAGLSWGLALGLLVSLWSANGAAKAMFLGLNIAYEEREKRGIIALNLATLGFTLGLLLMAIAAVAFLIAAPLADIAGALSPLWAFLRWPVQFVFLVLVLAVLYRFGPSRQHARWRWVSWGSALASLLWLGASAVFSIYVTHIAKLTAYGALGTGIGFLIWTYWSALIVLLGAELNAEIEHQTRVDSTTGAPRPLGRRGAKMADTVGEPAPEKKHKPEEPSD